jgi:acetyltransferase-like isoleucine patch superfamily enzyme
MSKRLILGAGSVVIKDVPANCVVGGIHAKFLKSIDENKSS